MPQVNLPLEMSRALATAKANLNGSSPCEAKWQQSNTTGARLEDKSQRGDWRWTWRRLARGHESEAVIRIIPAAKRSSQELSWSMSFPGFGFSEAVLISTSSIRALLLGSTALP